MADALSVRASRRQALAGAIAGGGASFASFGPVRAQDATPDGEDEPVSLLLVQWCDSGRAEPVADRPGSFTLSLDHSSGQTLYFADRPARSAGLLETASLLSDAGFFGDNPPNAALALATDGANGEVNVTAVELASGEYDPASGTLTYRATLLAPAGNDQAPPAAVSIELPAAFGNAWLFIDSIPFEPGEGKAIPVESGFIQ